MGYESANPVRWSKCRGLLCFITVVVACVLVPDYEKARSANRNLEPTAQAETAQQAPPIPPAGPLADPKSLKQFGVPLEATRAAAPADNLQTPEKIALGEKLFFDGRLSVDGTVACSTCHDPAHAFSDGRVVSIGVKGRVGQRNAPTILNALYNKAQFWDGLSRSKRVFPS
jgi:cytochrome c peroxidase